ncbi:HAD-IA family hydrolase [Alphaproteobacteria bacterium]|nr:HAD-IA family hydrolase [Alphaproteobacteria bacterium]
MVAFDLDGTILNSADDLIFSLNVLLSELGQKNVSTNQVNMLVGNGALAMIKKAFEINNVKSNDIDYEKLKQKFLDIYKTCYVKKSKLYPFTYEILELLKEKKIKMLLVSNKPEYFVKKILDHFNISKYFASISGGDTFSFRKPNAKHLTETIANAGIDKYNCIFIGDSIADAECAKNSKSQLILLEHGYSKENIKLMGADYIFKDLKQLYSYFKKIFT